MADDRPLLKNCDASIDALDAADQLITRLQDVVADQLEPDSGKTSHEAYVEIIEELETAPEIDEVKEALGKPGRFGSARG